MAFFSTTLTAATTAQILMKNKIGIKKVSQVLIRVRSMGTATYVGIGGLDSQDVRLTGAGQNMAIDTPKNAKSLDISSIFVSSDTSDAVLEIFGDSA